MTVLANVTLTLVVKVAEKVLMVQYLHSTQYSLYHTTI